KASLAKAEEENGAPCAAIELPDGRIVTGRTGKMMGACAGALMNALKEMANIPADLDLIAPVVIQPIQQLKTHNMGSKNPRLHPNELLVALAICAATNPLAKHALSQLDNLKGCEAHSTVIVTAADELTFKRLGLHLTQEPKYQTERLYHR
ncbi:MAG: DUF1846 family protein, partial [Clostridia bacterium]|nr:DUF1846 family protein [Clostridia bacterium]